MVETWVSHFQTPLKVRVQCIVHHRWCTRSMIQTSMVPVRWNWTNQKYCCQRDAICRNSCDTTSTHIIWPIITVPGTRSKEDEVAQLYWQSFPKIIMLIFLWPCTKNLWIISQPQCSSMTMIHWHSGSHTLLIFRMWLEWQIQCYQFLLLLCPLSISSAQPAW